MSTSITSTSNKEEQSPVEKKICDQTRKKKIFIFGPEGSGKSTVCNKIANTLVPLPNDQFKKYFKANTGVDSLSTDMSSQFFADVEIIDSPGLEECKDEVLRKQCEQLIRSLRDHDEIERSDKCKLNCVIFTLLAPIGGRFLRNHINLLYKFLLQLTVIYPRANEAVN